MAVGRATLDVEDEELKRVEEDGIPPFDQSEGQMVAGTRRGKESLGGGAVGEKF
jgi:hypothetical protein